MVLSTLYPAARQSAQGMFLFLIPGQQEISSRCEARARQCATVRPAVWIIVLISTFELLQNVSDGLKQSVDSVKPIKNKKK